MFHTRVAALALVVAAITASGCGKSAKSLTRAELTTKAEAICTRMNAFRTSHKSETVRGEARVMPQLAVYERTGLAELNKLIPPPSIASDWKEFVSDAQILVGYTVQLGEYAKSNNLPAIQTLLVTAGTVQRPMFVLASKDGFKECAQIA